MNLDATPETIRAVADMFELAALLDDRLAGADRNRIAAWSEQVERHRLTRSDLLDGLQAFYDTGHDRPIGVGDLIQHSRAAKRDRLEREEDEERERRRDDLDSKSSDNIVDFAAAAIASRVKKRTKRLQAAEAALQSCTGRHESAEALREYFAARREAQGKKPKEPA